MREKLLFIDCMPVFTWASCRSFYIQGPIGHMHVHVAAAAAAGKVHIKHLKGGKDTAWLLVADASV